MGYIADFYGSKKGNKDFIEGMIAGMTMFAWWKDGVQQVGTGGRTLKKAIEDVHKELDQ